MCVWGRRFRPENQCTSLVKSLVLSVALSCEHVGGWRRALASARAGRQVAHTRGRAGWHRTWQQRADLKVYARACHVGKQILNPTIGQSTEMMFDQGL